MTLPYHQREFLSPAELNFYRVLRQTIGNSLLICPKVGLGDLFYSKTGNWGKNRTYRNKIDRKHVDFVLCDPNTICPVMGIELDDSSHNKPDRQERDRFVEEVFHSAGLPLFRHPVKWAYNTTDLLVKLREVVDFEVKPNQTISPTTNQIPSTPNQIVAPATNQIPDTPSQTVAPATNQIPDTPSQTVAPATNQIPDTPSQTVAPIPTKFDLIQILTIIGLTIITISIFCIFFLLIIRI